MCGITDESVKFRDGSEIEYSKLKFENLTKNQIDDLNTSVASKYDILIIRKSIHTLRNDIFSCLGKIQEESEQRVKDVHADHINDIKNIKEDFDNLRGRGKRRWKNVVDTARDISVLVIIVYYIITLVR